MSEWYEVLAVRYGTRQATAAEVFLSFPVYGEPDRPLGMDYFFWVAPGIELTQVGGHTPGQAIVTVNTGRGPLILASDAVHYHEELERDRPFSTVVNLADMYAAFDQIREMEQDAGTRVIAGHDTAVTRRFPAFDGRNGVFLLAGQDALDSGDTPRNGTER